MKYCITCCKKIDTHTGVDTNNKPKPGDITFCMYCGTMYEFNEYIGLRRISAEERKKLINSNVEMSLAIKNIEAIIAARNKMN